MKIQYSLIFTSVFCLIIVEHFFNNIFYFA